MIAPTKPIRIPIIPNRLGIWTFQTDDRASVNIGESVNNMPVNPDPNFGITVNIKTLGKTNENTDDHKKYFKYTRLVDTFFLLKSWMNNNVNPVPNAINQAQTTGEIEASLASFPNGKVSPKNKPVKSNSRAGESL